MACVNDIFDIFNPTAGISCGTDTATDAIAGGAFESIVNYFARGASQVVYGLTMGWMDFPAPDLGSKAGGPVTFLQESMGWFTAWTAVLCLLIAAGRMMWLRRAEPGKEALMGLLNLVLVSSGGVAFIQAATRAGDAFSTWVVAHSLGCDPGDPAGCEQEFGKTLLKLVAMDAKNNMMAVTFILALLLIVSSYIQMAFLIARNAMLILLAGTLPLAAAASGTEAGRGWFRKQIGWTLAFILFKPVAAVIYAAAFAGMGQAKAGDTWTQLYGVTLLLLAALSLPALMRFVTPLVSAAAVGGAGAGAAVAGGVSAIATGAVAIKTLGGSIGAKSGAGAAAAGARQAGAAGPPSTPPPLPPSPVPAGGQGSPTPNGGAQTGGTQPGAGQTGGTQTGGTQAQPPGPPTSGAPGPSPAPAAGQQGGGQNYHHGIQVPYSRPGRTTGGSI